MALPAAAAAAYQNAARIASSPSIPDVTPTNGTSGQFSDFLSGAIKDSINSIKQGEQATQAQAMNNSNVVDVVHSMNAAELTLDTVVAVRDKVVSAYQAIMNMPI
ncbi:MAG TPA: flagellar hook-basal body complex protein FliE [Rhizomicrobium sp.]|jgi:flagellar hook-basal body complex protein FliE|nr:flagellar hook-basal body complex protein FliE [Rhizomicrobium sp.]